MDNNTTLLVLGSIFLGSGLIVSVTLIFTRAWQKVSTLKTEAQVKSYDAALEGIESVRRELTELRDTTTRYDMSFDTALQRLESRIGNLESRSTAEVKVSL